MTMDKNKNQQATGEETKIKEHRTVGNTESKNKDQSWQNVMIGGVPGILLGAGGVFVAQAFAANPDDPIGDGHGSPTEENDIPVAHSVNDDMSFGKAFATAREEVGPGGAFSWHGNVYSTYRSDDPEWIAMGHDGQAAHCHDIIVQVHAEPYTPDPQPEPEPEPEPEPDPDPEPDPEPNPDDVDILDVRVDDISDDQGIIPDDVIAETDNGMTVNELNDEIDFPSDVDAGMTDVEVDMGM